ncbi:MAG: nucleoside-diphosphate sugar epimerase/dehydratase [Sandaracinus sp.]
MSEAATISSPPAGWWAPRRYAQFLLDTLVLVAAFVLAYAIRFDLALPDEVLPIVARQVGLVVTLQFAALLGFRAYSLIWRYVGLADLRAFLGAALVSSTVLVLLRLGLPSSLGVARVPLSVTLVDTVLAFGGVLSLRVVRRVVYERVERNRMEHTQTAPARRDVLLVGAGRAGQLAVKEILSRPDLGLSIRGILDDDAAKLGMLIHGVAVIGDTSQIARLASELRIDHVIITIAHASRAELRRIVEQCERAQVRARIIPGLYEILDGRVEVSRVRDVDISDLLGRDQVQLDPSALVGLLSGKTVLVSGAGGSIGSELCRQVARFAPKQVLLLERSEPALFVIHRELTASHPEIDFRAILADVTDEARLRKVFRQHRPQVVVHAAAHKHVPLVEENCAEAVRNNVLGTRTIAQLAGELAAEVFVLISTDKAVRPSSVMGATKRMAELVVLDMSHRYDTRFVAVRFGNVLGSAGSVIPIFREQIRAGGPVTVTHPDMVRFFMTIPEASQLVLQAGALGEGGQIFVLDMGEPVKIVDLARDMITLSGLRPGEDIEIEFSGIRPGEKLAEELSTEKESLDRTRHPKIWVARPETTSSEVLDASLDAVVKAAAISDDAVRLALAQALPESSIALPASEPGPLTASA